MPFLRPEYIEQLLGHSVDLSSLEGRETVLTALKDLSQDSFELPDGQLVKQSDTIHFVESFNSEKAVFYGWISQHQELSALLSGNYPKRVFADAQNWKGHALYDNFRSFLTPFLYSTIKTLSHGTEDNGRLLILFSFIPLFDQEHGPVAEAILFTRIRERMERGHQKMVEAHTEQSLTQLLLPLCSDDILQMLNYLSRASYGSKRWYVDQLLSVISMNACTVRLANLILRKIESLELNTDHLREIAVFREDLKQGKIKVRNSSETTYRKLTRSQLLSGIALLVVALIGVWMIWKKPFSNTEPQWSENETSFQQFSREERRQIDSLLKEIRGISATDDRLIDPGIPLSSGPGITIRTSLQNKKMEQLYRDLLIDAALQASGSIDSCSAFSEKEANRKRYQGVLPMSENKGTHQVLIRNESAYSVNVFCFEDLKNGEIHSYLLKRNGELTLELNEEEHLLFVAGNEPGPFIAPATSSTLPSAVFDHHFCSVDDNYQESLSRIFYLSSPQKGRNKILLTGDRTTYFSIIDLYGIFGTR